MTNRTWPAILLVALAWGCGTEEAPTEPEEVVEAEEVEAEPGALHVEFPAVRTKAEVGNFVLAPSRESLDRAMEDGKGALIFYGGEMVEVGEADSKVKSLAGTEFTIPNALIVAAEPNAKAAVGDILLGHWESGSGAQRAIVTGGTDTEPVVRYLDIDYDNPSGAGKEDDTWKSGRFRKITGPGQIGSTVACQDGDAWVHGYLVNRDKSTLLVTGFASEVTAHDKSECVALLTKGTYAEGDTVHVPVVGKYTEGEVVKVDEAIGRVWVKYNWGGEDKEVAFAVTNVTKDFEDHMPGGGSAAAVPGGKARPGGHARPEAGKSGKPTRKGKGKGRGRPE